MKKIYIYSLIITILFFILCMLAYASTKFNTIYNSNSSIIGNEMIDVSNEQVITNDIKEINDTSIIEDTNTTAYNEELKMLNTNKMIDTEPTLISSEIVEDENQSTNINVDIEVKEELKIDYTNVELLCEPYYHDDIAIRNSKHKIERDELQEILDLINSYPNESSFFIFNINDNMLITYNATQYMFAASAIKLPYTYYCISEIDNGTYSLDEQVKYEERFRHGGSGILQHKSTGDYYTIKELLHLIIHYSDNTAYYMLHSHLNLDNYKKMMHDNGFYTNVYNGMPWDNVSAYVLGKFFQKIYYNYINSKEDSAWRLYVDELKNSLDSPLKNTIGSKYTIASKSGWANLSYHESGIVFSNNPYILAIMTKSDGAQIDQVYMANLINKIDEFLNKYNSSQK